MKSLRELTRNWSAAGLLTYFYLSAGVIIYIMTWSSVDGPLLSRDGMHGSANRNTQALAPLQSA